MTILCEKTWCSRTLKSSNVSMHALAAFFLLWVLKVMVHVTVDGILDSLKYDKRLLEVKPTKAS